MTTFDELLPADRTTPEEREALVWHLATMRARKTAEALLPTPKIKDAILALLEKDTTGMSVIEEIAAERRRQIEVEGWTPEHDDEARRNGDLANAAASYAAGGGLFKISSLQVPLQVWPYRWEWNPKDRRRDMIRAAALLVAEIERIDREAARRVTKEGGST